MPPSIKIEVVFDVHDNTHEIFADLAKLVAACNAVGVDPPVSVIGSENSVDPRGSRTTPPAEPVAPAPTTPRRRTKDTKTTNGADKPAAELGADPLADTENEEQAPFGAEEPSGLSPAEARDKAMEIMRAIYEDGHRGDKKKKAAVTSLQRELVGPGGMFKDLPQDKWQDFYKRAVALAEQVGHAI